MKFGQVNDCRSPARPRIRRTQWPAVDKIGENLSATCAVLAKLFTGFLPRRCNKNCYRPVKRSRFAHGSREHRRCAMAGDLLPGRLPALVAATVAGPPQRQVPRCDVVSSLADGDRATALRETVRSLRTASERSNPMPSRDRRRSRWDARAAPLRRSRGGAAVSFQDTGAAAVLPACESGAGIGSGGVRSVLEARGLEGIPAPDASPFSRRYRTMSTV